MRSSRAEGGFVAERGAGSSGLPPGYLSAAGSSFLDFLGQEAAHLLPGRGLPAGSGAGLAPHATTIVAASFAGGVVMGGDRRATMGNLIASRDIDKVFAADEYSVVGIAGTAGIAGELVRLFQVELEHYEKIEGTTLSLDGKANRLAAMIRGNLGAAMQGLAVVPLFAGVDVRPDHDPTTDEDAVDVPAATLPGRIFGYDVTGGLYEERGYHAVGSGSLFAKASLKKTWNQRMGEDEVVHAVVEALYDAADEDSATGGPDMVRGLMPSVFVVTGAGTVRLTEDAVTAVAAQVIASRQEEGGRS